MYLYNLPLALLDDKSHSDNENIVFNTHFQLSSVMLVLGLNFRAILAPMNGFFYFD